MESTRVRLTIPDSVDLVSLMGPSDSILRRVEAASAAIVAVRGHQVSIVGPASEVNKVTTLFSNLIHMVESGQLPQLEDVDLLAEELRSAPLQYRDSSSEVILTHQGRAIRPKTAGQKAYTDSIKNNTITFGIGPAGTGKTYLAMAMAIGALKSGEVQRIILARPVVEAGESLGFLPGTLTEKLDPYVRPLYDALFDMTDVEHAHTLIERGIIEIAPLAFMRGRTFNNAFVILDEAQNTTPDQMKMFLTRLGFKSKFVITGDTTQRDLSGLSGLESAHRILAGLDEINFVELGRKDIVRNSLVALIVGAYEKASHLEADAAKSRKHPEGDASGSGK